MSGMRLPDAARLVFYHKEFFGDPMSLWTHAAMRGESAWTVGEWELLAAMTAKWLACPFCERLLVQGYTFGKGKTPAHPDHRAMADAVRRRALEGPGETDAALRKAMAEERASVATGEDTFYVAVPMKANGIPFGVARIGGRLATGRLAPSHASSCQRCSGGVPGKTPRSKMPGRHQAMNGRSHHGRV
jgi:hypothetical protein